MGLDELSSLDGGGEEFASLEGNAAGGGRGKRKKSKKPRKSGGGGKPPLPLIILLAASFPVILVTMWFATGGRRQPVPVQPPAATDSLAVADSSAAESAIDSSQFVQAAPDTQEEEVPSLKPDEQAVSQAEDQGYYLSDASQQQRFLDMIASMRERESRRILEVNELQTQLAARTKLDTVIQELLAENAELKHRLAYMEETLPEEVTRRLIEYQADRLASAADPVTEAQLEQARRNSMRRQAKIFETMKPVEAAKILTNMNDDDVALILSLMKERQAGKVMAELQAGRSARLTKKMGSVN